MCPLNNNMDFPFTTESLLSLYSQHEKELDITNRRYRHCCDSIEHFESEKRKLKAKIDRTSNLYTKSILMREITNLNENIQMLKPYLRRKENIMTLNHEAMAYIENQLKKI